MKKWKNLTGFIPMGVAITIVSLIIYGVVQQTLRLQANDVPRQMAEDAAMKIVRGDIPRSVIPQDNVDMSVSLSPFMIVYDDHKQILESSVVLDGKIPEIPPGVLDAAREQQTDNVTWQPKPGVRAAAVIVRYVGKEPGFVLAARSLREVERLEDRILMDVVIGWAVAMAASLLAYISVRIR